MFRRLDRFSAAIPGWGFQMPLGGPLRRSPGRAHSIAVARSRHRGRGVGVRSGVPGRRTMPPPSARRPPNTDRRAGSRLGSRAVGVRWRPRSRPLCTPLCSTTVPAVWSACIPVVHIGSLWSLESFIVGGGPRRGQLSARAAWGRWAGSPHRFPTQVVSRLRPCGLTPAS
jgi:hypothetical protein